MVRNNQSNSSWKVLLINITLQFTNTPASIFISSAYGEEVFQKYNYRNVHCVLRWSLLTTVKWNAFWQKRKQIMLNVNINWMQITADKVFNFNVEYILHLHFLSFRTQKNSTFRISNDVLVQLNITYPILSSSTWRILSARSKTFLMISCSVSEISVFVPVFLAGPLEWKDHPELSLKKREKRHTNDVL